jgi:dimethylhistidine N-methyltransferase
MSTAPSAWSKTSEQSNDDLRQFAADVRRDLSKPQKELHSQYLYDELGSSLFDAITRLPEYGLTRADERLLRDHSADIARLSHQPWTVIELGSGTGEKTRHILKALRSMRSSVRYIPIDVSPLALSRCEHDLADIAGVQPIEQPYLSGLESAVAARHPHEKLLILFLGSTIGNFQRRRGVEFLADVRRALRPGDSFLLGADLVKDRARMIEAYDDPIGLTAAFNLNLLGRINRELGGNFELRNFAHEARWNESERCIEMHLRSRANLSACIAAAGFSVRFQAGETIWTESSHKFRVDELEAIAEQTGFAVRAQWVDREWPFAESLWVAR